MGLRQPSEPLTFPDKSKILTAVSVLLRCVRAAGRRCCRGADRSGKLRPPSCRPRRAGRAPGIWKRGGCAEPGATHLARALSPYSDSPPPPLARISDIGALPPPPSAGRGEFRGTAASRGWERARRRTSPPQKALWEYNNRPGANSLHERVGTRSLDPPGCFTRLWSLPGGCELGHSSRALSRRLLALSSPEVGFCTRLEVLTVRRVHGEGNWESLPLPCADYPLPPTRGDEGRVTNPYVGHWGCLLYLMSDGAVRPPRESSLSLQLDIEATTDVVRAGSVRIKLSHILC
ncbi:hypothetical protein NDU88_002825 [Pleurodeles waltl]|uniref:Uncharacterized protein n=1 Tax=Pleurodeles waltl TaxID=8319 RepID=A0AAV7T3N5_PLEWA|nr:hypothetical protein NDU88_002825 [Pleurodeles waltl]